MLLKGHSAPGCLGGRGGGGVGVRGRRRCSGGSGRCLCSSHTPLKSRPVQLPLEDVEVSDGALEAIDSVAGYVSSEGQKQKEPRTSTRVLGPSKSSNGSSPPRKPSGGSSAPLQRRCAWSSSLPPIPPRLEKRYLGVQGATEEAVGPRECFRNDSLRGFRSSGIWGGLFGGKELKAHRGEQ